MNSSLNSLLPRPTPLAACFQCAAPVPQGWNCCIKCSESYASSYYLSNTNVQVAPTAAKSVPTIHSDTNGAANYDYAGATTGYYTQHVFAQSSTAHYYQQGPYSHHSAHHHSSSSSGYYPSQHHVSVSTVGYDRSPSGHSITSSVVSVDDCNVESKCGQGQASAAGVCGCCKKSVDATLAMPNGTCSKRCEWVSCGCCPQCGRYSASSSQYILGQPYCSIGCASQSHQANWCPTCGVRQMLVGSTHCSTHCAAGSGNNFPIRQRKKIAQQNQSLRHEVAADHDRNSLLQPLRGMLATTGVTVTNVVKCTPHTVRRKNYLTYRSHVEQEMVAEGNTAKYGFGGEGNEQRRYLPLAIKCTLGAAGSPFGQPGTVAECCEDLGCTVCVVLRHGVSKERLNVASHYCTSDFQYSLLHALQMPPAGPLRAVAICRAVVGTPAFIRDPAHIVPGKDGSHSTIIISPSLSSEASAPHGQNRQEGTYLFRDDAIEVLHIVLVRQQS